MSVPRGCPLTSVQYEVVSLLAGGLTYQQIAAKLDRPYATVRHQCHTGYRRLGVADRAQAVIKCERAGWLGGNPERRTGAEALLEQVKLILEDCLRQLEQGARHRVTPGQWAYLQALDMFVRRPGVDTDGRLGDALQAVLDQADVTPSLRAKRHRSPDLRVAA